MKTPCPEIQGKLGKRLHLGHDPPDHADVKKRISPILTPLEGKKKIRKQCNIQPDHLGNVSRSVIMLGSPNQNQQAAKNELLQVNPVLTHLSIYIRPPFHRSQTLVPYPPLSSIHPVITNIQRVYR